MTNGSPQDLASFDHTGKDPYISELGLLDYINAAEKQRGTVYLMQLYNAGLAHPWRMTQMLEELSECKLLDLGPDGLDALKALQPALECTRDMEGPLLKTVTADLARRFSSRGAPMNIGDQYTDVGMAIISFNRAAGNIFHKPGMMHFVHTSVRLTDSAKEVLKARGLTGIAAPKPRPFG